MRLGAGDGNFEPAPSEPPSKIPPQCNFSFYVENFQIRHRIQTYGNDSLEGCAEQDVKPYFLTPLLDPALRISYIGRIQNGHGSVKPMNGDLRF